MTLAEVSLLIVTLLVMFVGLIGAVVPALPGTPLIFAAALGHKLWLGERSVSWWMVGLLGLVTVSILVLDALASALGAKKMGATWRGVLGAAVGGILGMFWLPFGLLIGPFLGASILEFATGKAWHEAGRAGLGATLGFLAGAVGKLAACLGMIALWTLLVLWHGLADR
jgi:hypothetical protein